MCFISSDFGRFMLFSDFVVYCVYFVGCVSYCSLVCCVAIGICYVWLCVCVMLLRWLLVLVVA